MQLTFFVLIFCSYLQHSNLLPLDTKWRQSRYIIDNRRNVLFSKKTFTPIYSQHEDSPSKYRFSPVVYKRKIFPIDKYQTDLAVEASIPEPKYYDRYSENSLPYNPYKIIQALKEPIYETEGLERQNVTNVLEPQNFIQNYNEATSKRTLTLEGMTEPPQSKKADLPSTTTMGVMGATAWEYKTEENNQIDNNEKHVYETRIETVSYHQEVIFNPPKKENWFGGKAQPEENYEQPEENYEQPEKIYEEPEENYEEHDRNYEEAEKNYKEAEKNYEEPEDGGSDGEENQNKFGYVVEGRNYRKYRVEERTADGFIVGEYGVMSHDDGSLRGVRYTAEEGINPKLIYETLIKFLSL